MTRFIKGEDGKFVGSIGIGKNNVPTAAPEAQPPVDHHLDGGHSAEVPTITSVYRRYQDQQTATPDTSPESNGERSGEATMSAARRYAPEAVFLVPTVALPAATAAGGSPAGTVALMAGIGAFLTVTARMFAAIPMADRYRRLNGARHLATTPAPSDVTRAAIDDLARTRTIDETGSWNAGQPPVTQPAEPLQPAARRRRRARGRGKRH